MGTYLISSKDFLIAVEKKLHKLLGQENKENQKNIDNAKSIN